MKRSLSCILFIILFNSTTINPVQKQSKNTTLQKHEFTSSWYYNYFVVKEFYNLITSPALLNNPQKMNDASITCCKCHKLTSSHKLWAYFMAYNQEPLLQKLIFTLNNGTTEELALFTLQKYRELEIRCDHCFTHSGWYIPESRPSSDN